MDGWGARPLRWLSVLVSFFESRPQTDVILIGATHVLIRTGFEQSKTHLQLGVSLAPFFWKEKQDPRADVIWSVQGEGQGPVHTGRGAPCNTPMQMGVFTQVASSIKGLHANLLTRPV